MPSPRPLAQAFSSNHKTCLWACIFLDNPPFLFKLSGEDGAHPVPRQEPGSHQHPPPGCRAPHRTANPASPSCLLGFSGDQEGFFFKLLQRSREGSLKSPGAQERISRMKTFPQHREKPLQGAGFGGEETGRTVTYSGPRTSPRCDPGKVGSRFSYLARNRTFAATLPVG